MTKVRSERDPRGLTGTNRAVGRFYNGRGTAEQWIKEGPDLSRRLTQGAGGMSSERGTRRRCL
jgi:hypothetical protein